MWCRGRAPLTPPPGPSVARPGRRDAACSGGRALGGAAPHAGRRLEDEAPKATRTATPESGPGGGAAAPRPRDGAARQSRAAGGLPPSALLRGGPLSRAAARTLRRAGSAPPTARGAPMRCRPRLERRSFRPAGGSPRPKTEKTMKQPEHL